MSHPQLQVPPSAAPWGQGPSGHPSRAPLPSLQQSRVLRTAPEGPRFDATQGEINTAPPARGTLE